MSEKARAYIAETKYATEDVVVADIIVNAEDYAVDPKGKKDSTAGIQKALDDCYAMGGGTVFLPVGDYRITATITIPAYTVLRGDWQDPDEGQEYGTVILADVESVDTLVDGTFRLGAAGGAYGLTVYYPQQSIENVKPYPFAFYFNSQHQGKGGHLPTVQNCTVINGYRGVGACAESEAGHEQLTIENFKGTLLNVGVGIGHSSDVGTCTNISMMPKYWTEFAQARGLSPVDEATVAAYTRENLTCFRLADVEWTEYIHMQLCDCAFGVRVIAKGRAVGFAGSFYDTRIERAGVAVQTDSLDSRWGVEFANCHLEGSTCAVVNNSQGMIKIASCEVVGGLGGDGEIVVDEDDLSDKVIDTHVSYNKPAAVLYVAELDATGETDVSVALQTLLCDAARTGGVVYLPAGDHLLNTPVTVPSGVELRGSACTPTREQGIKGVDVGTRIMVTWGLGGNAEDRACVTLCAGAGVNGIRFCYPTHSAAVLESAYAVRGVGEGVYAVNCCVSGGGRGIDFGGCDKHLVKKLTSFCYLNDLRVGGKNGTVTGFLHNGTVRGRAGFESPHDIRVTAGNAPSDVFEDVNWHGRQNCTSFIVEQAEGERIWNNFSFGVTHMIYAKNSCDTWAVNLGTDNINGATAQVVVDGGDYTAINVLRYNGHSFDLLGGGKITLYTRLAIWDKSEKTVKVL